MPVMRPNTLPVETLLTLRQQLDDLPPRAPERHTLIGDTATLYGVSPATVYRALRDFYKPKLVGRTDRGQSRRLPTAQMERYCELIAALKVRTTNRQGHHLSTARALELMTNQFAIISRVAVGTSRHTVLRAPVTGSCLEAVHALCEDTGAILLQDVDGFMVYQAPDWETRPAQARLLPQDIISGVAWRAETNRVINSIWIKYGPEAGRLDYQVYDQPSAYKYSVRHVTLDTQLADEVSAITTANLIITRRVEPLWMLGQVEVDTRLLSVGDVTMVQALRAGDAIVLPLLPEPAAAGEYSEWTVQGWAQVWEVPDSSRITLSVLDRGAGAAGINRWSDLDDYTWGQLATLTWGQQLTGDLP